MDQKQMRNLMEQYGTLRVGIKVCEENIRRIIGCSFEEYIEQHIGRNGMGEVGLHSGRPASLTEALGIDGRRQFEDEKEIHLCMEWRRLEEWRTLLRQLDSLIGRLDGWEHEIIVRRYVNGERIDDMHRELGLSRATAFRRLGEALSHMAELHNERSGTHP